MEINNYVNKIDISINKFRFNVTIANFYEVHKYLKNNLDKEINNKIFTENTVKIMKLMIPLIPHLAYECLELLGCKEEINWPIIQRNFIEEIKIAIQINGKTRDIITTKKDLNQDEINKMVLNKSKANKYILNKKIIKTIFVKNKIINYIILNK